MVDKLLIYHIILKPYLSGLLVIVLNHEYDSNIVLSNLLRGFMLICSEPLLNNT